MKKMRLFSKTFLFTMLLMSAIILVSHMLLYFMLPEFYIKQKNQEINQISNDIAEKMESKTLDEVLEIAKTCNENENVNILVRTSDNTYVYNAFSIIDNPISAAESVTGEMKIAEYEGTLKEDSSNSIAFATFTTSNASNITIEKEVTLADGTTSSVIASTNLQPVSEASGVMFMILPYTLGISIFISLCAAYLYAKAITNPIRMICASTKEMEDMHSNIVCPITSQDEIGELAGNINSLYASLQDTIGSLEQEIKHVSEVEQMKVDFLRSASHELKTPLTSISVILENMMLNIGKYKDHNLYLQKCKSIVDQLSAMIKDILDASSLEGMAQVNAREEIQLQTWMEKVSEPYLLIARSKGLKVDIDCRNDRVLHQNPVLLHKVISNALSNAVQYTKKGHTVSIQVKDDAIIIENECIPIETDILPHLSEAFYRPDFSRNKDAGGNGLGLYIIDQVSAIMRLPYTFEPYDRGMRFTLYVYGS